MQEFLRKIVHFGILLCLLISALTGIAHFIAQHNLAAFPVPEHLNTLILGDSHIASGIDQHIIQNAINVGSEGESYFISYYKIQVLTEQHPTIDTILLGASYHNFSGYYEQVTLGNASTRRYFFILPLEAKIKLLFSMKNPLNYLVRCIFYQLKNVNKNGWTQGQRFEQKTGIKPEIITKRIKAQYYQEDTLCDFAYSQIAYFKKINAYCATKNITLIVLNTPLHLDYQKEIPEEYKTLFYQQIQENELALIEFEDLELKNEDYTYDGDHLSYKGVPKASKYLRKRLKKE